VDYIRSLASAYEREESPAAKDAIAQILINSRMCAEGHRPICQDTGIVTVFLEGRHGRALGRRHDRWRTWSTRACAAPTTIRTTSCAPRAGRPGRQAHEHQGQHAGVVNVISGAGQHC
jgi:hypothetical protein